MTEARTAQTVAAEMRETIKTLTSLMNEGKTLGVVLNFSINETDIKGKKVFVDQTTIQKIETL